MSDEWEYSDDPMLRESEESLAGFAEKHDFQHGLAVFVRDDEEGAPEKMMLSSFKMPPMHAIIVARNLIQAVAESQGISPQLLILQMGSYFAQKEND
jgi:hypothetical protein